jgi:3-hydroxyacyl-CoA dehydrogenase/enoyl-CoA hydratase/3-hydroxybutyryl-CoA epimerase
VNRILFPYFDEAVRLVAEGHPIADVDREAKRFGMPMGPLELLDTVGIDVAADVAGHLSVAGMEESPTPAYLADLVSQRRLGEKSGCGFYRYKGGRRRGPFASSAAAGTPHLPDPVDFDGETVSGVQQRLILSLMNAAAECLQAGIVPEAWMVDLGMVLGTGFAPFRGGPLRLAETWGRDHVRETLERLSDLCGPRFQPSAYFSEPQPAAPSLASDKHIPV